MKTKDDKHAVRSGGVDINASGDVYIGGDVVGRDKITVFDTAAIQWLALGTNRAFSWLRLAGVAGVLGLLVAMLSRQLFGTESITDSAAAAILHAAIGAIIGGLVAWYSPSLPAALLRVTWIEGSLIAAEWIFTRLVPVGVRYAPSWFGLPILHASLLVSLVGGPWLALTTFALISLVRPSKSQPVNRQWWAEAVAIIGGCMASGLLVLGVFGNYLRNAAPPIDPSRPLQLAPSDIPIWTSGAVSPDCQLDTGYDTYLCPQADRFDTHQEGFIVLPGWLGLSQAVAILISLAMIIPVSAALFMQTSGRSPRLRRPTFTVFTGFTTSAAIGVGLDLVAATMHGQISTTPVTFSLYEQILSGPMPAALLWGLFGLLSALVTSALHSLIGKFWLKAH